MIAILLLPAYVVVGFLVFTYYHIETNEDGSSVARYVMFWPLYFVRWLVVNFVLAIRGL
jgi:hypothetical protein